MRIEKATEKDINELYEMQLVAFESEAEMVGSRSVPALMESPEENVADFGNWTTLVMRSDDGKIVGAARYRYEGDHIDIGRIMTLPEYRGQGIATELIGAVEKHSKADAFELFTCTKSYLNIKLYERLGYRIYKEEKGDDDLSFAYFRKEAGMADNVLDMINVNTQSSIRIESENGVIYFDPIEIAEEAHDADIIMVTHDHSDHFSPGDIAKIAKADTVLVVPEKMAKSAETAGAAEVKAVAPGERYEVKGLAFETVPAYNKLKPFHPKRSGWVGYIIETDGVRIYVAGDTDMTDENSAVSCDIAMVPIGGTFTMDAKQAAELVNRIGPKTAIPTHYGSIVGKPGDADTFRSLVDPAVAVETKL